MARTWEGALEAGLSVVVGVVLGYYADRWLGTEPIFLFIFMILGGVAGFRRLLRIPVPPPAADAARDPQVAAPGEPGARVDEAKSGDDRADTDGRLEH